MFTTPFNVIIVSRSTLRCSFKPLSNYPKNKINSHIKIMFQFVSIHQTCKPNLDYNQWKYFSIITINNTYSYSNILVTHIK
jgi:hypothetical protein